MCGANSHDVASQHRASRIACVGCSVVRPAVRIEQLSCSRDFCRASADPAPRRAVRENNRNKPLARSHLSVNVCCVLCTCVPRSINRGVRHTEILKIEHIAITASITHIVTAAHLSTINTDYKLGFLHSIISQHYTHTRTGAHIRRSSCGPRSSNATPSGRCSRAPCSRRPRRPSGKRSRDV